MCYRIMASLSTSHSGMLSMEILEQYTSTVKRFITNHNSRNGFYTGNFEPQEIRSGKWMDSNGAKSKDVEIFEPIADVEGAWGRVCAAQKKRQTRCMDANKESSRSNLIITMQIKQAGSVTVFDLAGKEDYPADMDASSKTKAEHYTIQRRFDPFLDLMKLLIRTSQSQQRNSVWDEDGKLYKAYNNRQHALIKCLSALPRPASAVDVVLLCAIRVGEGCYTESKWTLDTLNAICG